MNRRKVVDAAQDAELRAVQSLIERSLHLLAQQEERLSQLREYGRETVLYSAKRTLANMHQTLTVLRIKEQMIMAKIRRCMSLRMMEAQAQRGDLLAKIHPNLLPSLLQQHDITQEHADHCIRLAHEWKEFTVAERWNATSMQASPLTVEDAVKLLENWRSNGYQAGIKDRLKRRV